MTSCPGGLREGMALRRIPGALLPFKQILSRPRALKRVAEGLFPVLRLLFVTSVVAQPPSQAAPSQTAEAPAQSASATPHNSAFAIFSAKRSCHSTAEPSGELHAGQSPSCNTNGPGTLHTGPARHDCGAWPGKSPTKRSACGDQASAQAVAVLARPFG